ncbi:BTB/POZ domain-containing protein 2-like [Culicoides brevitarsis]|uniref:BTB/POZ domain-containing protein 2-like n=1 Tax=Culicoides brevitarsis TaxID=469753 RepID=UPI00307C88E5
MSYDNFKASLLDLFVKQKNCDVQFICNDPASGKQKSGIMAHKLILSLASDVFNTMFYGEATKHEDSKKTEEKPVKIDDIELPTFKLFLSFIYTKSVEFETPEMAVEFYYAAHKYNCLDALEFIKNYMLTEVNAENCTSFYAVAHLYENSELKAACAKIFSENTVDVLNSPKFLDADPKTIEAIFKLDALKITSEKQLVDALERYIKHNVEDDPEIAQKVRPALCQIRFLTLTPVVVAETTLLDSDDALMVIGCLTPEGDVSKMPTWLSMNAKKRTKEAQDMDKIRKLSNVYFAKYCVYCGTSHASWNCSSGYLDSTRRSTLKEIYEKYKHVFLIDYEKEDVESVFEIFKAWGRVE